MDDDVAASPHKAIRWPTLGVDPFGVRRITAAVGLIIAALLTDRDPPERSWSKVPVISEAFAAWSIGFIVMAVAVAVIAGAHAHTLHRMNGADILFIAFGALMLIPIVNGTSEYLANDLSDISTGFVYLVPSVLAIMLTVIGLAVSGLMSALRLLVLISASALGAFTAGAMWERRFFDSLNIVVVIACWVAVITVVIAMTLWTPDDRWSDEPRVQGRPLPAFLPEPRIDDEGRR